MYSDHASLGVGFCGWLRGLGGRVEPDIGHNDRFGSVCGFAARNTADSVKIVSGGKSAQKIFPGLEVGATENTDVLTKSDNALYLGLVQKFQASTGDLIVLIGSSANTILNNRVMAMHLIRSLPKIRWPEWSPKAKN